jgi:hypothetical protein
MTLTGLVSFTDLQLFDNIGTDDIFDELQDLTALIILELKHIFIFHKSLNAFLERWNVNSLLVILITVILLSNIAK